jgi:RNA-dependent RNA polymerase
MEFVVIHLSSFVNFCYFRFCLCLDGLKTGMTVKDEILKNDTKTYQKRPPEWKETEEERNQFLASGQNEKNLQRPKGLRRFIMDELHELGKGEKDMWLARIESHFEAQSRRNVRDEDLVAPWDRAMKLGKKWIKEEKNNRMKQELDEIAKHVERVYEDHRVAFSPKKASSRSSPRLMARECVPFTELPIEARQDAIRKLSRNFVSFPPPGKFLMQDEEIARLRASYAYKHDHDRWQFFKPPGTSFPWDVGMRELGAIKARATGGHKTVVGEFYDHFNMKNSKNYHI